MKDLTDYYSTVGYFRGQGFPESQAYHRAEEVMEALMKWETFANEFNRAFGPPCLPDGFAHAELLYDDSTGHVSAVHVSIGNRDADFDVESGECMGAGMVIKNDWEVIPLPHR